MAVGPNHGTLANTPKAFEIDMTKPIVRVVLFIPKTSYRRVALEHFAMKLLSISDPQAAKEEGESTALEALVGTLRIMYVVQKMFAVCWKWVVCKDFQS